MEDLCVWLCAQLIHFVNRDSEGLAKDFVMLDFIPVGTDLEPIARALRESFGDEGTKSQLDFQVPKLILYTLVPPYLSTSSVRHFCLPQLNLVSCHINFFTCPN